MRKHLPTLGLIPIVLGLFFSFIHHRDASLVSFCISLGFSLRGILESLVILHE